MERLSIKKNIKSNKAQSLISIMLFVMVLGIIVTLIIASSITDTKRLVSQKSYERAYSLSESYLSKILANTGEVFGVNATLLPGLIDNNGNSSCEYTGDQDHPQTGPVDIYTPSTFKCSNSGPNQDSQVTCTKSPTSFGLAMTGVKDKKMKINLAGIRDGQVKNIFTSGPKLAFMFNDADAILFNFNYTKIKNTFYSPQTVMFGIKRNDASEYTGFAQVNSAGAIDYSTLDSGMTPVLNRDTTQALISINSAGIPSNIVDEFYDSLEKDSYPFALDLGYLASNIYAIDDGDSYNMTSISVVFLNKDYKNAKYSVVQIGFPQTNHLDTQFQRTSCKALDSTVAGSGPLISGFGSAELETYIPLNKTVAGIFDYALFVGRENQATTMPLQDGYGSSVIK